MRTFLMTLHIVTCISLIIVVLLQRGKGADMGAAFGGGGANTVFGARGAGNFLTRITTGAAIIFMVTSLSLSYLATQDASVQIFDDDLAPVPSAGALEDVEGAVREGASNALVPVEPLKDAPPSDGLVEIQTKTVPAEPGVAPNGGESDQP